MTARASIPTLPIQMLRDGIAREAARYSLRRVAREVGISPNGLRGFLASATPRMPTRAKLERWLADQGEVTRPPNVGQFVRLLNQLTVDLSPAQAALFGRAIAELLIESYAARRAAAPRWVHTLVRHYGPRGKVATGGRGIAVSPGVAASRALQR